MADYFGTTKVHFVVNSKVFGATLHTHTFEDTRDLMDEVFGSASMPVFTSIIRWRMGANWEKM